MPAVPHYPSDEPETDDEVPDLDRLRRRIVRDGPGERPLGDPIATC